MLLRRIFTLFVLMSLFAAQAGCFYYAGSSTTSSVRYATGKGYLKAREQRGQWDADGPPPQVGEVIDRSIYQRLDTTSTHSLSSPATAKAATTYTLSGLHPYGQYLITGIREIGTTTADGAMTHYYEVEFESRGASLR
jgi:hypothetical protein